MKTLPAAMIWCLALLPCIQAGAEEVTPGSLIVSSTFGNYQAVDLINDSGLIDGLHDNDWTNMWLCNELDGVPWLVFDLGAQHILTGADIWNYNWYSSDDVDRGVDELEILVSDDNVIFSSVWSGNLTIGTGSDLPAEAVSFSATGRYVRFEIGSNHGDPDFAGGLSEVKFEGIEVLFADGFEAGDTSAW